MRVAIDCRICGTQIFFDIEAVSNLNPMEIQNAIDIFGEKLKGFSQEDIKWAFEQLDKGKEDRKTVRFFERCPKCGMPHTLVIHGVLLA